MRAAEPGRPGRRAQTPPSVAEEKLRHLEQQVLELQRELQASKAREEIALVLARCGKAPEEPEKKTITRFKGGVLPRSVLRVFAITPRVSSSSARLA